MPMKFSVKSDFTGLKQLQKNFNTKRIVKLGILGNSASRSGDSGLSNSEIGARHEFGVLSEGLPRRSFLRDPLDKKKGEFGRDLGKVMKKHIATPKGADIIYKTMGILGENIVDSAFESGGFGLWQSLSQQTISEKGSSTILIDTAQLRRSILSKVEKKGNK